MTIERKTTKSRVEELSKITRQLAESAETISKCLYNDSGALANAGNDLEADTFLTSGVTIQNASQLITAARVQLESLIKDLEESNNGQTNRMH